MAPLSAHQQNSGTGATSPEGLNVIQRMCIHEYTHTVTHAKKCNCMHGNTYMKQDIQMCPFADPKHYTHRHMHAKYPVDEIPMKKP